jgi:sugar O-acyltransferase (sialic acid O-acetyltransferase NeuD family)
VTYPDSTTPILGLGAGTHAKSVIEAIRSRGDYNVVALVDEDSGRAGTQVLGIDVLSGADALDRLRAEGVEHAFVGVGGILDSGPRRRVHEQLRGAGLELPAILHATAVASPTARVGHGAQLLAGAIVNVDATIGDGAIVNTGAIVEHDCRIGSHAHIAPGARLAGLVTVGEGAHVGIGAIVIEGVGIGVGSFVAAGAVVVRDVEDGTRVAGVPAREMAVARASYY